MIQKLHGMVWGPVLLTLLLTVGIAYTLRSGGFPLFGIKVWWRETVGSLLREDGEAKRQKGQYVTKEILWGSPRH